MVSVILFYWEIYLKSLFLSLIFLCKSNFLHIRRSLGCMWHKSMWAVFEVILHLPFPNFHPSTAILTSGWYLPLCCSMLWDAEPYGFLLLDHLANWLLVGFSNGRCCQIWMRASGERERKRHNSFLFSVLLWTVAIFP